MVIAVKSQAVDRFIVDFQRFLHMEVSGLKRVSSTEQCDFILDFCLITSRAGTDIDGAIENLNQVIDFKPVIMGVLYPTFDPEKTILDSKIKKDNIYLVDFLFNEDQGFMKCQKNNDAIKKLAMYIKSKNHTSYCLQNGNFSPSSKLDKENTPLITNQDPLRPKPDDRFIAFLQEKAVYIFIVAAVILFVCGIAIAIYYSQG